MRCLSSIALAALLALGALACRELAPAEVELPGLEGSSVRPLAGEAAATVLLFTLTDCPIANRYAPRVRELVDAYEPRGVRFWLVYPDGTETDEEVRRHLEEYGYADAHAAGALGVARDPGHALVALSGATVTPEAAVYGASGELLYRGRIDDRYADFGKTRPRAEEHDLARALDEVLAGRPVSVPRTEAVGCYIPDP